ncbi:hypothetical protein GCM10010449_16860 [Streptomyces rectiviolaceus]|uniref:Uncharacterized protein n=1 Tax=Streptomyces rectiviolaceus TaxID=332591 RepID=A0ABP6MA56_9ACTN
MHERRHHGFRRRTQRSEARQPERGALRRLAKTAFIEGVLLPVAVAAVVIDRHFGRVMRGDCNRLPRPGFSVAADRRRGPAARRDVTRCALGAGRVRVQKAEEDQAKAQQAQRDRS